MLVAKHFVPEGLGLCMVLFRATKDIVVNLRGDFLNPIFYFLE
jgi:hypothetical protein